MLQSNRSSISTISWLQPFSLPWSNKAYAFQPLSSEFNTSLFSFSLGSSYYRWIRTPYSTWSIFYWNEYSFQYSYLNDTRNKLLLKSIRWLKLAHRSLASANIKFKITSLNNCQGMKQLVFNLKRIPWLYHQIDANIRCKVEREKRRVETKIEQEREILLSSTRDFKKVLFDKSETRKRKKKERMNDIRQTNTFNCQEN